MTKTLLLDCGSGGRASQRLINELFLEQFDNPILRTLDDAARLELSGPIAMSTDGYTVTPLFFPGGDIGKLFPDADPAYEGADSLKLLAAVADKVRAEGYEILDVDSVIAAQRPKISPHRDKMRENLARAMGVPVNNVGVKATTTERLGFEGREEGISATAVALLCRCR